MTILRIVRINSRNKNTTSNYNVHSRNPLVLQINSPHIVVTSFDFFIDSTAQIKALSGHVKCQEKQGKKQDIG